MNEIEEASHDRLKLHFAQRVTHQARQLLDIWQQLQNSAWNAAALHELLEGSRRLLRYAERFQQDEHRVLAQSTLEALSAVEDNNGRLSSSSISQINQLMQRLSRTGLRHHDQAQQSFLAPLRKPVYLCLGDHERALRLAQQLEFFGIVCQILTTPERFRSAMGERHPAALVMDIDFAGHNQGLGLAAEQNSNQFALIFFSQTEPSAQTRLEVVRCGGRELLSGNFDASSLLERIEAHTHAEPSDPYKVLIIDDSRAQATHTERVLNSAGIVTHSLTNPLQTIEYLDELQPDLIILDMYMPGCNGTELAKVIRHNDKYVGVPIIFLSAEDDLDKQLEAMSEGGDDFLTKPIKPRHLIATVRTRCARAQEIKARMVRDSLTGLYNHTHILQLLDDSKRRGLREQRPLSFAMLDIDHFKQVNDRYGHPMGDRVIKTLALFLQQRLRKSDYIGRYGGEEFAIIMPDTDAQTAAKVLDTIRQRFSEIHYPTDDGDLHCTFSSGVAPMTPTSSANQLVQQADSALYRAKHAGRNQVQCFNEDQDDC